MHKQPCKTQSTPSRLAAVILQTCLLVLMLSFSACNTGDPLSAAESAALAASMSSLNKTVIGNAVTGEGDNIILYSDSSWAKAASTEKIVKSKTKKRKGNRSNNSAQLVNVPTGGVGFSSTLSDDAPVNNTYRPRSRQSKSYRSQSSSSFSGTCGAPTKKGGACRRTVRGGGTCWQH